jgi:hypothetical protein
LEAQSARSAAASTGGGEPDYSELVRMVEEGEERISPKYRVFAHFYLYLFILFFFVDNQNFPFFQALSETDQLAFDAAMQSFQEARAAEMERHHRLLPSSSSVPA